MLKIILLGVLSYLLELSNGHRILAVMSYPSFSHQAFYQPIWRELALRGHEVVVVTTNPTHENIPNLKEISIEETYSNLAIFKSFVSNSSNIKLIIDDIWTSGILTISDFQMNLPQYQALINNKSEHFDLLFMETLMLYNFGLKHRFNCPTIVIFSMDPIPVYHSFMGNADHFLLYPSNIQQYQETSNFLERVYTLTESILLQYHLENGMHRATELARKYFGEDMPPIKELAAKTDLLFANNNPVFRMLRPVTPGTVFLYGGMHIKPKKALPDDIKQFLDSGSTGVIYMSFGSNVKSAHLSKEFIQVVIDTFSELPFKFLWKLDTIDASVPDNVMIIKWAPQHDVLRHRNIKLFITQGGLQSLEEALIFNVPVVVIPFFFDQYSNARSVVKKGLGLYLKRFSLTVVDFKSAILEVIQNKRYKEAVKKAAVLMLDTQKTPLDNAVWWTEYVLRHKGAQHLKGPMLPFYQHYYLDIVAVFTLTFYIIVSVLLFIVRNIWRLVSLKREEKMHLKQY